jgi:hypothetical protein
MPGASRASSSKRLAMQNYTLKKAVIVLALSSLRIL